jgi:hypothetical protein
MGMIFLILWSILILLIQMPDVSLSPSAASTQVVPNGGRGRGEKGAYLTELRRTQVGEYRVEGARLIDEIEELGE